MVYQPLFDLPRLVPVGAEALSRFPQGTPDPADWFRNAHSVGLGVELELAALSNAFPSLDEVTGFLSVNVSSETVCSPKFGRMPAALPMHRIVIELTEHAPIEDYDTLNEALGPLRRNGLRVAIDDAGAGYACMRHILSIVPDFIKLDLSLVRGIDSDLPRQALAAALAAFAFTTDALVVAEGIETVAELATLERLGIHYGQGYHLGHPSSAVTARSSVPAIWRASGWLCSTSRGTGSARHQFSRSVLPGTFGRARTARASSSEAASSLHSDSARAA